MIKHKIILILVMALWGSLGIFVRNIPISSLLLAFSRAVIALPILMIAVKMSGLSLRDCLRKENVPLMISGVLIGLAWVLFFAGFRLTSIANVTFIYNMCPIYVLILSPILLKEKISRFQILTILVAFVGFVLIIGQSIDFSDAAFLGIMAATFSGILYALIVIINRKYASHLYGEAVAFIQLLFTMLVLLPFVIGSNSVAEFSLMTPIAWVLLLILGLFHTGLAYIGYFQSYKTCSASTVAQFTYLDPAFALLFGYFLASESLTMIQAVGGLLILGSTFVTLWIKTEPRKEMIIEK
jgi:drug/metabolite transporter (DMT)-like permease